MMTFSLKLENDFWENIEVLYFAFLASRFDATVSNLHADSWGWVGILSRPRNERRCSANVFLIAKAGAWDNFFCCTALTSTGWVRMTIKLL